MVRQGNEEGLEDYKGLAEAGIQVEMGRIHDGPEAVRALHRSQRQFRGGIREVAVKVHDYFMECRKLVQELGALGEQNAAE